MSELTANDRMIIKSCAPHGVAPEPLTGAPKNFPSSVPMRLISMGLIQPMNLSLEIEKDFTVAYMFFQRTISGEATLKELER